MISSYNKKNLHCKALSIVNRTTLRMQKPKRNSTKKILTIAIKSMNQINNNKRKSKNSCL